MYFVAASQADIGVLRVPFRVQTTQMSYQGVARAMVDDRLHMDAPAMMREPKTVRDSIANAFAMKYDGATVSIGKVIVAVLIPLYAIVLQVLYIGRRRFFAEHLVLATHLTSFLLVAIAAMGVAAALVQRIAGSGMQNDQLLFGAFFVVAFGSYAYLAQRDVYGTDRAGAVVATGLLALSMVPILVALKFVLFVVTLHWVA